MRSGVQAVRGQLVRSFRHHLYERGKTRQLLQREYLQQSGTGAEEHGRERDRFPVAAVEVPAKRRPLSDARLVQVGDGLRSGAEVGCRHNGRVLGQISSGMHPAPKSRRAERAEDGRTDPKVLRRRFPRAEGVLGQRQPLLYPQAEVRLLERRTQLSQRALELFSDRGAVLLQLARGLRHERIERHSAGIVAQTSGLPAPGQTPAARAGRTIVTGGPVAAAFSALLPPGGVFGRAVLTLG